MANQSMYLGSQLVPFAQVLGVTGAAMLSGLIVSASYVSVPVIAMAPPDLMAKQWAATYSIGKATAPPIAVTCSICFAFLASQSTKLVGLFPHLSLDPTSPWALYTAAALAIPAIVPYTLGVMQSTNDKLHNKAEKSDAMSDDETRQLLQKWKGLNYNRAIFVAIGSVLGAVATCMS